MPAVLESNVANPLYRQLMSRLTTDISNGTYPIGSKIPSEFELCQKYAVSRITVRKAIEELSEKKLLIRQQGKGTFVSSEKSQHAAIHPFVSFHEICQKRGEKDTIRVLFAKEVRATEKDCEEMGLTGGQVVETVRVRYADETPVLLEIRHFCMAYAYLLESDLKGSLYNLLRGFGTEPTDASHEISLCYADERQARALGIEEGQPLIRHHQVVFDQNARPIHTSDDYLCNDSFVLQI